MSDEASMSAAAEREPVQEEARAEPEPAVIYSPDTPAAIITLNRPELCNAVNDAMVTGLHAALDLALDDEAVRAVIVTGAGTSFCSGQDVREAQGNVEQSFEETLAGSESLARLFRRLRSFEKVTIAAVNGPALASGCGLATLCDFTLAIGSARFGYPEVKVGFVPAVVSVYLRALVSEKMLRQMLLTGQLLSADEAEAAGLINAVVPADDLLDKCRDIAEQIARNAPGAIQMTKELLETLPGLDIDRALKAAVDYSARTRGTDECQEGISAFIEKREPTWVAETEPEQDEAAPSDEEPSDESDEKDRATDE